MQMNLATVHTNQLNAPIDISYQSHRWRTQTIASSQKLKQLV